VQGRLRADIAPHCLLCVCGLDCGL
jgi:hypothetical protein